MERKRNFDFLKIIACLIIFVSHFITYFHPDYYRYWSEEPTKYFLSGITGKMSVAFFAVIMGYLAYAQGLKKKKSFEEYAAGRYVYFLICGLLINTIYKLAGMFEIVPCEASWFDVLYCSFGLKEDVFPMLWWLPDFFVSSVLCFSIGRVKWGIKEIVICIILAMLIKKIWIAVSLLGAFAVCFNETRYSKMKWLQGILCIVLFFLIQNPESFWTFFFDGIFAIVILMATENIMLLKKICNNPVAKFGAKGMSIFLIHSFIYQTVGPYLFELFDRLPYKINFLCSCISCFLIVIVLAYPFSWIVEKIYLFILRRIDIILNHNKKVKEV